MIDAFPASAKLYVGVFADVVLGRSLKLCVIIITSMELCTFILGSVSSTDFPGHRSLTEMKTGLTVCMSRLSICSFVTCLLVI